LARIPVDDRLQISETSRQMNARDVRAPNLAGILKSDTAQPVSDERRIAHSR